MTKFQIRFPEWKAKAFTLSYDDGQIFDRRLVDLFDRYHLKATFHLNSGTLGSKNANEEFLIPDEIEDLFEGHEIACHGVSHPYMCQLPKGKLLEEILEDKKFLEKNCSSIVRGMSYPFGQYNNEVINIAKACGIEYSRTVNNTHDFSLPSDFMQWNPTCHHNEALECLDSFFRPKKFESMLLFYVWGHSYEFDRDNTWTMMEAFCRKISNRKDVWYATTIEIKDYICATRSLVSNAEQTMYYNPSGRDVYIETNIGLQVIESGKTVTI